MKPNKMMQVYYYDQLVGTLAKTKNWKIAFAYDEEWLENGFAVGPFSLPLKKQVFVPEKDYFGGLFGAFADSLPDAWGRLLLERVLKKSGKNPEEYGMLDRLAIIGDSGMGALTYRPAKEAEKAVWEEDFDVLAEQCKKILLTQYSEKLDDIYRLGGSSGGARPKIMTKVDGEDWIIKFPAHVDSENVGKMEYDYYLCALKCGIEMSESRLFASEKCEGYFGTKRFDRKADGSKIHMLTASAILEMDFEQPVLDYADLMKLTRILTENNRTDMENMYRRMCFNVYAHNRDDHAKNFSFLYEEEKKGWRLSPAYDLTYSTTYYGEHTTTVAGNGRNPSEKELIEVGAGAGLEADFCRETARNMYEVIHETLNGYLEKS